MEVQAEHYVGTLRDSSNFAHGLGGVGAAKLPDRRPGKRGSM